MKKEWTKTWNSSKAPSKQRKYRYNAPLHVRRKFMHVHLSPELRKETGRRQILIRKGDEVKIMRGQYSKKKGVVKQIKIKKEKIYIEGIENVKKDGTKVDVPLKASNIMIVKLYTEDKKRKISKQKEEKEKK